MAKGMKDFVAAAKTKVGQTEPAEAQREAEAGKALILDVREAEELASAGRVAGAHHVPRGFLEVRADPDSGASHERLTAARGQEPVLVLCASGGRAALAAERLSEMGYQAKVITGGLAAWKAAGLPVEEGEGKP